MAWGDSIPVVGVRTAQAPKRWDPTKQPTTRKCPRESGCRLSYESAAQANEAYWCWEGSSIRPDRERKAGMGGRDTVTGCACQLNRAPARGLWASDPVPRQAQGKNAHPSSLPKAPPVPNESTYRRRLYDPWPTLFGTSLTP